MFHKTTYGGRKAIIWYRNCYSKYVETREHRLWKYIYLNHLNWAYNLSAENDNDWEIQLNNNNYRSVVFDFSLLIGLPPCCRLRCFPLAWCQFMGLWRWWYEWYMRTLSCITYLYMNVANVRKGRCKTEIWIR